MVEENKKEKILEIKLYLENVKEEERELIIKDIKNVCLIGKYPHGYYLTGMWSRLLEIEKELEEKEYE